jgi:FkbM family methyltransferase
MSTEKLMSNEDLKAHLLQLHARHSGGRIQRTLRSPYKMVRPLVMRKMGISQELECPTFWGGTFSGVLPEAVSTLIWRTSYFDEEVSLTLLKFLHLGGTFVDIGAHFGFFSLLASHLVGPTGAVTAIEAMPSTFSRLEKNIKRNRAHDNVKLYRGAAFDKVTELEFFDFGEVASSLNSAFGSRGPSHLHAGVSKVFVSARPADRILEDLNTPKVSVVKIDAESSERYVLSGIAETVARDRPVIVMEVGDIVVEHEATSQELILLLREQGYSPFHWRGGDLLPFRPVGPVTYANLVFLPEEIEEVGTAAAW